MDEIRKITIVRAFASFLPLAVFYAMAIHPSNARGAGPFDKLDKLNPAPLYAQATVSQPQKTSAGKNPPEPYILPEWLRKLEENHPYIFRLLKGLKAKGMADHTRRLHARWRLEESHELMDIPGQEIPLDLVWVGNDELRVVTMKSRKFNIWRVTRQGFGDDELKDLKNMPILCAKKDGSSWAYIVPSELNVFKEDKLIRRYAIDNKIRKFLGWNNNELLLGGVENVFRYHLTESKATSKTIDLSDDDLEKRLNLLSSDEKTAIIPTSSGYSSFCFEKFTSDGVSQKGAPDKNNKSDDSTLGCWKDKKLILSRIRPNGNGVAYILQKE